MPIPILPLVTSLGPSILNGISSLFTNASNADINAQNREWQSQENQLSRQFTREQNIAARGFEAEQNQLNRDWQEKMWNLQNEYNTPSAMMKRYEEAGFNPLLSPSLGQGVGVAGSSGSPSMTTSPNGTAPMSGAPSSIPMQAPRFDVPDMVGMLGVSANVANQHARTVQQKWETYAYIRNNVSRSVAKEFLDNNPDMFEVDDPDNNTYMESYNRAQTRETLENSILWFKDYITSVYGVKTAEKELYKLDQEGQNLEQLILNHRASEKEIMASVAKINEQIRTEKTIQVRNMSESDLATARAKTEDESRKYIVKRLLLSSNILSMDEQTARSVFESNESLRGWLTSSEAKDLFAKAAQMIGKRQADALYTAVMGLLQVSPIHGYVSPSGTGHTEFGHYVESNPSFYR